MGEKCSYEVNGKGVALVTICNPPMNALDDDTMLALESVMKQIHGDERVHAAVVTGDGPNFIIGADINRVQEVVTAEEGEDLTGRAQGIINMIEESPIPVIAAINGMCLGGGMELAMACHIRIAGDEVKMGLPEIRLGIMPAFGGSQRSARLLGTARALDIMLTGRFIDMDEAVSIGLVNRTVPQADVLAESVRYAEKIAEKSRPAVRAILEGVMKGITLPLEDGLRLESRLFGRLAGGEDKKEGIAAFLEKRKPQFKQR